MSNKPIKVYQSLARGLKDNGVDTLFGLIGDANLFMVESFISAESGKFSSAVHEGSAVLMAIGFARVSGKVGVATITHGPALTNCVTALTEGTRARVGMVLMAGDTPDVNPQHLQSINQREIAAACGAGFEQIRTPETAVHDLARALFRAKTEHRPIILNMPADFMWQETQYDPKKFPAFQTKAYVPEGPMLDEAVGMIASAKRPLILAGLGAIDAKQSLEKLANRLEAPLATTLKAKGLFHNHPFSIDLCGTLSTNAGYDAIEKSDCVVAFGASLNEWTTDRGKLFKGKRLIQIDTEATQIGQTIHPNVALIADAGLTAENFIYWLDEAEIPASGFTNELNSSSLTKHERPKPNNKKPNTINYVEALEWLETILPENRVLATDGGRFMTEVWCRLSVQNPRNFIDMTNFGSIGLGLQAALGAGVAKPDCPVVVFSGDGGFMMGGLTELNTAVRLRLDIIVIICNDAAYGAEHIQFLDKDMDPMISTFDWPSFANVASSLGATGTNLRNSEDFQKVQDAIEKRTGPVLIDMHLDPFDVPRMRV